MVWFWVALVSLALLFAWAAWRQKRYGGTTAYDRDSLQAKEIRGPHTTLGEVVDPALRRIRTDAE